MKAEVKTKEQAVAEYSRQLDTERAQVEELETSLLMQVNCSCPSLPLLL